MLKTKKSIAKSKKSPHCSHCAVAFIQMTFTNSYSFTCAFCLRPLAVALLARAPHMSLNGDTGLLFFGTYAGKLSFFPFSTVWTRDTMTEQGLNHIAYLFLSSPSHTELPFVFK